MGDAARRKKHALETGEPWPPLKRGMAPRPAKVVPDPDASVRSPLIMPGTPQALASALRSGLALHGGRGRR